MQGWENELSELMRTRHRALVSYAFLLSGDLREAEDLVQDAIIKVFSRRTPRDRAISEAYVRTAIFTIYLDAYRRRRRWAGVKHLISRNDAHPDHNTASDSTIDMMAALAQLPPRQRACVALRYYEDLPVAEIAVQMGCSVGTVKRLLFNAHGSLRTLLGSEADVPTTSRSTL